MTRSFGLPSSLTFILLLASLCASGCEWPLHGRDAMDEVREAMAKGDWMTAQHGLERILATDDAPGRRWEAWRLIAVTAERLNPGGPFALGHLRDAYEEFRDDEGKAAGLLRRLAEGYSSLRMYGRAADCLAALARLGLEPSEALSVHSRLAALELHLGDAEAAEDACLAALALPVSPADKAGTYLTLAEIRLGRRDLDGAEKAVAGGLAQPGVESGVRGRLLFAQADILDIRGRFDEALQAFMAIREIHPNPSIVDLRIGVLRRKTVRTIDTPVATRRPPLAQVKQGKKAVKTGNGKKAVKTGNGKKAVKAASESRSNGGRRERKAEARGKG